MATLAPITISIKTSKICLVNDYINEHKAKLKHFYPKLNEILSKMKKLLAWSNLNNNREDHNLFKGKCFIIKHIRQRNDIKFHKSGSTKRYEPNKQNVILR